MVLLHFKLGEKNQFIIETTTGTPITDIIKKGVEVNNLRCKIDTLCMVIEELMKHGPLKTEETLNEFLIGLYSTLYVALSSSGTQKYFTSSFFSFQLSSTKFLINLLLSHVTHSPGKPKSFFQSSLLKFLR